MQKQSHGPPKLPFLKKPVTVTCSFLTRSSDCPALDLENVPSQIVSLPLDQLPRSLSASAFQCGNFVVENLWLLVLTLRSNHNEFSGGFSMSGVSFLPQDAQDPFISRLVRTVLLKVCSIGRN